MCPLCLTFCRYCYFALSSIFSPTFFTSCPVSSAPFFTALPVFLAAFSVSFAVSLATTLVSWPVLSATFSCLCRVFGRYFGFVASFVGGFLGVLAVSFARPWFRGRSSRPSRLQRLLSQPFRGRSWWRLLGGCAGIVGRFLYVGSRILSQGEGYGAEEHGCENYFQTELSYVLLRNGDWDRAWSMQHRGRICQARCKI